MTRRYVYDPDQDRVVEVPFQECRKPSPAEQYERMLAGYRESASDTSGKGLREASLERAERREFAHRRLGDERRWRET